MEARKKVTPSPAPKIQKVIFVLRDHKDFKTHYEPRAVSLGHIHHGIDKYQLGEQYKLVLTYEFVKGNKEKINYLYKKIGKKINELRDCFEKEVTKSFDDEELIWLLLVDGCAILQYIYCAAKNKFTELNIKPDSIAFTQQDLFLLENQLPYRLLKWLISWSENKLRAAGIHVERSKKENSCLRDISFTALGCLGFLWLPPITVDDSTRPKFLNLIAYEMCLDFQNDFGITYCISFLDSLIDEANDVKMLRKAGILYNCLGSDEHVAKLFNEIDRIDFIIDRALTFWSDRPSSSIISNTSTATENIKIKSRCSWEHPDLYVAPPLTGLVPNSEIYSNVRVKIQKHYKNQLMTWLAQVCHDHFSSPWAFLAFFGALLALALTVIQTWYAVKSTSGPCYNFCKNFTRN
ncbi:hypothetical protein RGQ29_024532 [Quercus rubra]|uniref:Uncharacterized protein n=1 Tax=Quercus rubra TaxID=3512 RepID=A0AAN7EVA6_QUERU|nr:hypothetical protein RGQ29_024532 [Quercus rubra]